MSRLGWVTSRWTTRLLGALTILSVAAFAISVLPGVRPGPGFVPLLDGWLQGGSYLLLALVALRSLTDPAHRRLRLALVASVVLRAAGFVLFLAVVRRSPPPAYPSIADALWLTSSVLLVVAVSYVAYRLSPRASLTLVLDAVVAALVTAGIAVMLLFDTLVALADPSLPPSAVMTNLAYPLLDVALLTVVAGLLVAAGGHVSRPCGAVVLGAVGLAVVDCVYFYQLVNGSFAPGSPLAVLSLASTALLAWAGSWLAPRAQHDRVDRVRGLATPAVLATIGLVALFLAAVRGASVVGVVLVTSGILVAIARALLTREQDADVASEAVEAKQLELQRFQALVEASSDFVAIGTTEGQLLYLNPRGREMVGLGQDVDVSTTSVADYLQPTAYMEWQRVRRPAMLAGRTWRGEQQLRHWSGGDPVPVVSSSFQIQHPRTGEPWLLATVQRDISERLAQEERVQHLADERQVLLAHLVEAQEDERSRIAADVHDDAVQALSVVELRLHLLRRSLEQQGTASPVELDLLQQSVQGANDRLRHLLFDLESPARETDLAAAIEGAAAYVLEDSVRWSLESEGDLGLPVAVRVVAYRVVKEALVNVRKHAEASHVGIRLGIVDGGIEISVADDGLGFDTAAVQEQPGHLGLRGMRDRATVAGGRVEVVSEVGVGTTVTVVLPHSVDPGGSDHGHH